MTELLEQAIAELKKLLDTQQDEVAIMILKQIKPKDRLSSLLNYLELNSLNTEFTNYSKNRIKSQQSKISIQSTAYKYRFVCWSLLGFFFFIVITILLVKIASEISVANFILICIYISLCMALVCAIFSSLYYIYETYKAGKISDAKTITNSLYKYQDYFLGIKISKSISKNSCIAYRKKLQDEIDLMQESKEKLKYSLPTLLIVNILTFYLITGIKINNISNTLSSFTGGASLFVLILYLAQFIIEILNAKNLSTKKDFVSILDMAIEIDRNNNC